MTRRAKDKFRSGLEREVAALMDKFNLKWEYEAYRYDYLRRVPRGICTNPRCRATAVFSKHRYTPDFTVKGKDYVIEAKGRLTSRDRTKLIAVSATGIEVRLIFRLDNKLHKNTETRYSDWCKAQGFKYSLVTKLTKGWFR